MFFAATIGAMRDRALRLYGQASDQARLAWSWVDGQLTDAGLYWVIAASDAHPHPRPVWGVWHAGQLYLSLGSPSLRQAVADDRAMTVHLESGTDVVIVEGWATLPEQT